MSSSDSTPSQILDSAFQCLEKPSMGFWELVRADVAGMVIDKGKPRLRYGLEVALKIVLYPRIQCVLLFRLSQVLYHSKLTLLAYWLQSVGLRRGGAELHPAAQIGPGFCLVHSNGVVIGDRARIGSHFICFQDVTVGDSGRDEKQPVLGHWVSASAGAKILGGISVGSGAVIGANAVVLRDVPPGGVAVGIPARIAKVRAVDEMGRPIPESPA
ncbi:MAG TPA: hypothetical protein VF627_06680 [Abditibacterium sp.]